MIARRLSPTSILPAKKAWAGTVADCLSERTDGIGTRENVPGQRLIERRSGACNCQRAQPPQLIAWRKYDRLSAPTFHVGRSKRDRRGATPRPAGACCARG